MTKHNHITLEERIDIEAMLKDKQSFTSIALALGKHPSTISKEIRSHLTYLNTGGRFVKYNACKNRVSCEKKHICNPCHSERHFKFCKSCSLCNKFCDSFIPEICSKLSKPPYVCNGCSSRLSCTLGKRLYNPTFAHNEYISVRRESRCGISFSEDELAYLDNLISPLIRQNQSPHHIYVTNADKLMISERTIYRLIDSRAISAMNIDLPRKVRFKPRKKKSPAKVDKACRIGRTYDCFKNYLENHPDTPIVQLDSVEGSKGGKVLLTIHFVKAEMMLAFLRSHND